MSYVSVLFILHFLFLLGMSGVRLLGASRARIQAIMHVIRHNLQPFVRNQEGVNTSPESVQMVGRSSLFDVTGVDP